MIHKKNLSNPKQLEMTVRITQYNYKLRIGNVCKNFNVPFFPMCTALLLKNVATSCKNKKSMWRMPVILKAVYIKLTVGLAYSYEAW